MRTPPFTIRIALHFYYSPEPYPEDSPAFEMAVEELIANGIIKEDPDCSTENYVLTPRGKAWVEMICYTPFPILREIWVDGRSEEGIHYDK